MIEVLLAAKAANEQAADADLPRVRHRRANAITQRYHDTLDGAFASLPEGPPPRRRHTGGWTTPQRDAWNLATRLRSGAPDVLHLLRDSAVPFDNNTGERALRISEAPRQDQWLVPKR